jgi:hypothetical protein
MPSNEPERRGSVGQKGEQKPITFRRPLNLALVISDINKAG